MVRGKPSKAPPVIRMNGSTRNFLSLRSPAVVTGNATARPRCRRSRAVRRRLTTARCIVVYGLSARPRHERGRFVTGPVRRVETIRALPVYEGL